MDEWNYFRTHCMHMIHPKVTKKRELQLKRENQQNLQQIGNWQDQKQGTIQSIF